MSLDVNDVQQQHIDALADLLRNSPALQQAVGVTSTGVARLDKKGVKQIPPTFGVSADYKPVPYPRVVYRSRTEYAVANSAAEEKALLSSGYKSSTEEFAPEVEPVDEMAELRAQVAMLTQRLAATSDSDLKKPKKTAE